MEDYKVFFDDAPVALLRTCVETGKFQMANKFAASLFGCQTVEELMNNYKSTDFYPPSERKKLVKALKKYGFIEGREIELKLKDGRVIWIRANFRLNCGGTCIECFLTDITELVALRDKTYLSMQKMSEKLDSKIASLAS